MELKQKERAKKKKEAVEEAEKLKAPTVSQVTEAKKKKTTGPKGSNSTARKKKPPKTIAEKKLDGIRSANLDEATAGLLERMNQNQQNPEDPEGQQNPEDTEGQQNPEDTEGQQNPEDTEGQQNPEDTEGQQNPEDTEEIEELPARSPGLPEIFDEEDIIVHKQTNINQGTTPHHQKTSTPKSSTSSQGIRLTHRLPKTRFTSTWPQSTSATPLFHPYSPPFQPNTSHQPAPSQLNPRQPLSTLLNDTNKILYHQASANPAFHPETSIPHHSSPFSQQDSGRRFKYPIQIPRDTVQMPVALGPPSLGVLIYPGQLINAELVGKGSGSGYMRRLMDFYFTREVLASSSYKGLGKHHALDEDIMAAIVSATKTKFPEDQSAVSSAICNKCSQARKYIARKKAAPQFIRDTSLP
ncbi:uncharacterized protein LOC118419096 isoform X2 [Branchiostoma floridae]|uniref:Uncharacterized protein LOC118419096 isoform X2 n=1 Tax=Branchiostoma floridae TaxID=7739 RepID=A0A9J7LFH0_BRAFL|nr:uncharacterized protein LOC118419096 isoform X2 [Branchiostoma floridae]